MLQDEIIPYVDGYGLVAPHKVTAGTMRSCDNGTMFLGEYYDMLYKSAQSTQLDSDNWEQTISTCMLEPGLVARAPGAHDLDAPDNMLGILSAGKLLNSPAIPRQILWYGLKHFGWFNQENPGSIYGKDGTILWAAFLWRQYQLVAATVSASRLPWILRLLFLPSYFYAALVIAYTGLKNIPNDQDMDSRRLCWHLVQIVAPDSWMCRQASKVWYWKLHKDFPPSQWEQCMRGVAAKYYEEGHPFIRYWID